MVHPHCSMFQCFIPLYCQIIFHWIDATFYLCIQQLTVIFIIFSFLLLLMLLWTFRNKFLCGHRSSFLLGVCLGVEMLDHIITLHVNFWGTARLFSIGPHELPFPQECLRVMSTFVYFFGGNSHQYVETYPGFELWSHTVLVC
jgi:hypothetical protein